MDTPPPKTSDPPAPERATDPPRRWRTILWDDTRRSAAVAAFGCLLFAVSEFVATLVAYPAQGTIHFVDKLRLLALSGALAVVAWLCATLLLAGAAAAARGILALRDRARARAWSGLYNGPAQRTGPGPAAPWLLAGVVAAVLYASVSTALTFDFTTRFKEPLLRSILLSILQVGLIGVGLCIAYGLAAGFRRLGRMLQPRLHDFNPFGRLIPAVALLALAAIPEVIVFLRKVPQARELVPWRNMLALASFAAGAYAGTQILPRIGGILPRDRRRRRIAGAATAAGLIGFVALTLLRIGAHPQTKYVAVSASPPMTRLIDLVRTLNDFDRDGYGSLLGENDCGPFNSRIHPGARDIPDNGIDENCNGRDFSLSSLPTYRKGERMAVPKSFRRNWNFLLITIDATRFDHTTVGGYARNTTPNLQELAQRSVVFNDANAPSAGTMASVPAILTSKFFHDGIALDDNVKRGMPPRLKPSNVLLSEVLKRANYTNGAILTHEYFNDWGMEQGFDTYDKELGVKGNPYSITSDKVTDKAIAWISRHSGKKWFLWCHYLDPHGRYVAHPGETSYGSSEMDLYDGEIHYTDKHLGRLFRELARMPDADRTIIIITADHGDAFREHGFINHGQALYRELLNVPLIVAIPDLPARRVDGPVTPLDILPTMADLAGIDISDLSPEGESLVPQLFYGRDAKDRIVFSETNWPRPLRAAISDKYKLILHLKSNVYELYDRKTDPWEKRNVASHDTAGMATMKPYLDDWLERVYYNRNREMNQVFSEKLTDTLLTGPPHPNHETKGLTFDDGRIELLGFDTKATAYGPGDRIPIAVYFHATHRPTTDYRFQVEGWLEGPDGTVVSKRRAHSKLRFTHGGLFPTGRWRDNEYVRDRFAITIPRQWAGGDKLVIGLRLTSRDGKKAPPSASARPDQPDLGKLGQLVYRRPTPAPGGRAPGRNPGGR